MAGEPQKIVRTKVVSKCRERTVCSAEPFDLAALGRKLESLSSHGILKERAARIENRPEKRGGKFWEKSWLNGKRPAEGIGPKVMTTATSQPFHSCFWAPTTFRDGRPNRKARIFARAFDRNKLRPYSAKAPRHPEDGLVTEGTRQNENGA